MLFLYTTLSICFPKGEISINFKAEHSVLNHTKQVVTTLLYEFVKKSLSSKKCFPYAYVQKLKNSGFIPKECNTV